MISFCEKEVYVVYEEEINRRQIFSYYLHNDNKTNIILVKNYNEEFAGIITYERILYSGDNFIQREKLYVGADIWDNAYKLFEKDKNIIYLPVFDKNDELVYFCYKSVVEKEDITKQIIKELYENEDLLFIKELYPKIKVVYLYDLNEIAYEFYKLLIKRNIPVVVFGDKWEIISDIKTDLIKAPSFQIMTVHAEGIPLIVDEKDIYDKHRFAVSNAWGFLYEIGVINRVYLENYYKEYYTNLGVKTFICRLPLYEDLSECTVDEEYRHYKNIVIFNESLNFQNENIRNQIYKIYNMDYSDVLEKLKDENIFEKYKKFVDNNNFKKIGTEENIIYVIGPCIVNGFLTFEEDKLLSCLYRRLSKDNLKYSIKGIAISEEKCNNLIDSIESLSLREKDIIIIIGQNFQKLCQKHNIKDNVDLNLKDLFNSRDRRETWFMELPAHTTRIANESISDELIEKLIKPANANMNFSDKPVCLQKGRVLSSKDELRKLNLFIRDIRKYKFETDENAVIGSIVMNCNPITLGHLYLIDYASKTVDYLYIFVVQENKSFFSFEDRYNLVKKAVEKYKNIRAIPSGEFIISNKTLPDYFTKEYEKEKIIDASMDIGIFAEYIAPALNIKIRFAGEEPLDPITRQYNVEMKRTLTDYGMQFIEIPRKELSGEVISASRVRKLLKSGEFDEIRKLVPDVTYQYLLEKHQRTSDM